MPLEPPAGDRTTLARAVADFGREYFVAGLIGFIFAASAPVAIVLAVGTRGGLGPSDLASWLFGSFFLNGLVTLYFCWRYRQPLVFFWTIPGTVLVGPALAHLSYPEVIGAFIATGVLMLVLGLSGRVRRAMEAIPMPIVMAMVAGVFLRFGLDLVYAVRNDFWIAAPMIAAFVALTALPRIARYVPPLIGAMVLGGVVIAVAGRFETGALAGIAFSLPNLYRPTWSLQAMVELVIPLAITVLVVQNGQGFAVLKAAGHEPPANAVTLACGAGTLVAAAFGAVCSCLTGPTNAILTAAGDKARQYTGGVVTGVLAIAFGLFAPTFTRLMLGAPKAFIMALAGLAMLRILQAAFTTAFKDRFALGALVSLLVTVSDRPVLGIGAAFWGLVAGLAVSWLLERRDFAAAA
jgi:benzoate membrane transport protein